MTDIERMAREAIGPDEILALCELVRADERERRKADAKRYQWLRRCNVSVSFTKSMPFPENHINGQPLVCTESWGASGELLDRYVDAAIRST